MKMVKSNMVLPLVCVVLGIHIVASLVYKSIRINDDIDKEDVKGADANNPIADVVLLVVAGLCLTKCCTGKPIPGVMKGVCVVVAFLILIRSFPELLTGPVEGTEGEGNNKTYTEILIYGITGLVNAVVVVSCCC